MKIEKIRIIIFISFLALFFILEIIVPRRKVEVNKFKRDLGNILIVTLNNMIVYFFIPIVPIKMAEISLENKYGVLNSLELPNVFEIIISLIILDLVIYFQHRVFHKFNFLWKFHKMHHIDPELDTSSGFRFHPIEIIISLFIKIIAIYIIGVPVIAVIIFEIILNTCAMFNHSNIKLYNKLDKGLRKIIITPDMHRVHHSVYWNETNSNFGFSVPFWDYIFNSYCDKPRDGHDYMKIGINKMPEEKYLYFPGMLLDPFVK
ncbi:sterol desaturase family protein [Clostridium grantii]|uniref:Sterol desaturase/sphingolipid hydroxylase, fatty acid hydroxylase superfamily n=1 Tax=Clostridium grantii DSM 8605 TaxID=1121316 RepID=A0A1M5XTJ2_9CLOT|nr:sterol desaturase family protein [Clostridium grantii]SHI02838.1 Sterol desaturase/sphingolipid hydroxylase, fatty acid hydroxylase superfamily [Clostridium grantii DSM 8605]